MGGLLKGGAGGFCLLLQLLAAEIKRARHQPYCPSDAGVLRRDPKMFYRLSREGGKPSEPSASLIEAETLGGQGDDRGRAIAR
jgi:hypothetical protein